MKRGLFVTGTGTGVGKTVITAGLLRHLRAKGIDVVPVKPVQTGAQPAADGLYADDLHFCLSAAAISPTPNELAMMSPYCYEPACSPHLAGRITGQYPDIEHIVQCSDRLLARHTMVLVEGAGGIRVPLNESDTMLDLIRAFDFPVLLVAEAGLGTINHTLLSIEALRAARVRILGVVLNNIHECCDDDAFIRTDNPKVIERFGQVNVLGSLRYVLNVTPRSQAFVAAFEQDLANLIGVVEQELRSYDRQIDPA